METFIKLITHLLKYPHLSRYYVNKSEHTNRKTCFKRKYFGKIVENFEKKPFHIRYHYEENPYFIR